MQHLHLVSQQLVKMEVPENHQVPEDIGMLPIQLMKTPDAGSSFSFSTVGIKMEIPENLQVLENTGILPMEILTTPDPLLSLSFLAMERKIEIPENIQAPEDIGISPIGFTNNFKKPPKTKRTRRSHCKETTQILQAYFETSHHPSGLQMAQLAEVTGLNNKQVKAWFSNKRRSMRVQQMREEKEKAKVWKMITPGSPVRSPGIASPSSIFPKYQITAEMLVPHLFGNLPFFHPQWLSLLTTYSNVMQTTTIDELIESLARSPPIPDPSPVVQLLQASASSVGTSAALQSNSEPKSFDIENLLSR